MENNQIRKMVGTGVMTALVIIIYMLTAGLFIGPFNITFALIPIVVGAALYGWQAGAWLGLVFGATVIISGGANSFMIINAPGTIATCLLKGMLAGLASALVYKVFESKNRIAAVLCSAAVAPIVNTGVFLLGCLAFFMDTISEWASAAGSANVGIYMVTAFVGINFLVEFAVNLLLSSVIVKIIEIAKSSAVSRSSV